MEPLRLRCSASQAMACHSRIGTRSSRTARTPARFSAATQAARRSAWQRNRPCKTTTPSFTNTFEVPGFHQACRARSASSRSRIDVSVPERAELPPSAADAWPAAMPPAPARWPVNAAIAHANGAKAFAGAAVDRSHGSTPVGGV